MRPHLDAWPYLAMLAKNAPSPRHLGPGAKSCRTIDAPSPRRLAIFGNVGEECALTSALASLGKAYHASLHIWTAQTHQVHALSPSGPTQIVSDQILDSGVELERPGCKIGRITQKNTFAKIVPNICPRYCMKEPMFQGLRATRNCNYGELRGFRHRLPCTWLGICYGSEEETRPPAKRSGPSGITLRNTGIGHPCKGWVSGPGTFRTRNPVVPCRMYHLAKCHC